MEVYWVLFAVPALATLFEKTDREFRGEKSLFILSIALVAVVIGLRFEVGADWGSYGLMLAQAGFATFEEIPTLGDPGYSLINWIATRLDTGIWLVNLVCAFPFSYGLFVFSRTQPRPWLALAVAVPYLVIVVAMGYTRQGAALGFAMIALVALMQKRSTVQFMIWIILGATFHKSAILLVPIAALASDRGKLWNIMWLGAAGMAGYFVLLADDVDALMTMYVDAQMGSDGAIVRIAMNALPASMFLMFKDRFSMSANEKRMWIMMAWIALVMVPALILSPSSTAIDRAALYLIPMQLMVLSRLPGAFATSEQSARFIAVSIVAYSFAVQYVWLNFASYSYAWKPYQLYPI